MDTTGVDRDRLLRTFLAIDDLVLAAQILVAVATLPQPAEELTP